jgi:hypothetical protein
MPLPFSHFTTAALNSDFRKHLSDLEALGKELDEAAQRRVYDWARGLYARYGRVDFLNLKDNVGSGDYALSFHGLTYTLSGNVSWVDEGLKFAGGTLQLPSSVSNTVRAGFFVFKTTVSAQNQSLYRINNSLTSGAYIYLKYDSVPGAGSTASVLRHTRNSIFSDNFSPSRPIRADQFISVHFRSDDSSDNLYENGVSLTGGARTGLAAINPTGTVSFRDMGTGLTGTISVAMVFPVSVSTTALYTLAKSTICPHMP